MRTHCRRCGGIVNTERACKKCGSERHILPSVTAHVNAGPRPRVPRMEMARALQEAEREFVKKYDHHPDFGILNFRGGFSDTGVVLEIWEEA